ncbi:cytochrome P450 [Legionella sp. CNM-4043-24]|uniref:cytochrome P450 n=1 Tax=Legionella sp. CNM-4043-24 TaxID=3421646 RepID=UPI00403ABD26
MTTYSLMQLKQRSTPEEFSRLVREMGDIYWWEPGKFWVITSYDLAKEVLLSEAFSCDRSPFFISRMPEMNLSLIQDFFKVVGRMMVMSDAPAHTSRRRICYHGFGTQSIEKLKPVIEQAIAHCLQKIIEQGSFDFVRDLAEIIPSSTLAELFAIPAGEREDFYRWSNNMTQFFGGSTSYLDADGIKVNHSAQKLYEYFAGLIEQRRSHPGDDFLSSLLIHQQAFDLTDDDIISQAVMMLVAGQVSTTDQLCNNAYILLSEPGLWHMLAEQREYLDRYLEECSRLDPAVTFIFRVTRQDTMLGGQFIKAGSVIFISTHAANRDPTYFKRPDELIVQEARQAHLGYGYGAHFCLGAKLARLEMNLVFQALLDRFPALTFDSSTQPLRKHHSLSFSGFERMALCL